MSRRFEQDIEEKLYHISETLVALRYAVQMGRIDQKFYDSKSHDLQEEYLTIKQTAQEAIDLEELDEDYEGYIDPRIPETIELESASL